MIPATSPATSPVTSPATELYSALDELSRAQREAAARLAGRVDWSRASLAVIRRLAVCGPVQLSDVAARLRVDVSVASRHVSQLVDAGFVRRSVDAADRRARVLELTEEGHRLHAEVTEQFTGVIDTMFAAWTPSDLADAAHQIRRVAAALSTVPGTHEVTDEEGAHR